MLVSEQWLREWSDPDIESAGLAERLTMAGLEVKRSERGGPELGEHVVIGRVVNVEPHPDADRLLVCTVDAGLGESLQIVCGATNVRADKLVPTALVGAKLPGGLRIRKSKLRGVESQGMLCSAAELGFGDDADGILLLDADAPVGGTLEDYLALRDTVMDLDLTPNRGDCFSILGVAREVAAFSGAPLGGPVIEPVAASIKDVFPIHIDAPGACPRFVARVVRNVAADASTPFWLCEKLRRAGIRPIHPVVDVTNYVMLELGQPLHSYDLNRIDESIIVRMAKPGEELVLLDGNTVRLEADVLAIADAGGAIGVAGIMGGDSTAVSEQTRDILFEAAFFAPAAISGRARRLALHTDASLRFERGVDPEHQERAIERATSLLLEIAGGEAGPIIEARSDADLPERPAVLLREQRLGAVLGADIPSEIVGELMGGLHLQVERVTEGWMVTPPGFRFDLELEEDLIEEVARSFGYDRVGEQHARVELVLAPASEQKVPLERLQDALVDRGYQEVITYSFGGADLQTRFNPDVTALGLANPISSELTHMRTSLWPGLVAALQANAARQQLRVRIFECGAEYTGLDEGSQERQVIAGLVAGSYLPEQWGEKNVAAGFYEVKADLEALLSLTLEPEVFAFRSESHTALNPAQCARIYRGDRALGWLGVIHPALSKALDVGEATVLFELDLAVLCEARLPSFEAVSRYPAVRRDIAVIVDDTVSVDALTEQVRKAAGAVLREVVIFDVYKGDAIESRRKSIALGLILQETSRTLTDEDADVAIRSVVSRLETEFGARIRD